MKWKLTCRRGAYAGQTFAFETAQVTVGRASTNTLALDPEKEPRVSGVHCSFFEEDRKLLVKDSGSTNGTLVDGVKIQSAVPVYQGSLISLGEKGPEFAVECDFLPPLNKTMENTQPSGGKVPPPLPPQPPAVAPPKPPAPPPLPPGPADAAPKPFVVAPLAPQPPVAPAPGKGPALLKLVCRSGALAGKTYEFTRDSVSVGRGESNNLRLDAFQDQAASTHHCEIAWKNGAYVVRDKESRNGTYINGQKIGAEAPLPTGAVLRLGEKGPEFMATYGTASAADARPAGGAVPAAKQGIGLMTLEGKLNEAKKQVSRDYRWKLGVVVLGMLFLLFAGGGIALWQWEKVQEKQRQQEAEVERLKNEQVDFGRVSAKASGAIYGVYICEPMGGNLVRWAFAGTAFAINANLHLLGTNSHVGNIVNMPGFANKYLVVVRSGDPKHMYRVRRSILHPEYQAGENGGAVDCPDVALLQTEVATIAGENLPFPEVLEAEDPSTRNKLVMPGAPVCLIGYPGEYAQSYLDLEKAANVAKLVSGSVSALVKFNQGMANGANYDELQHTCQTSGGNSGSPVLDRNGKVVALHFSGISQRVATITEGEDGKKVIGEVQVSGSAIRTSVNVKYLVDLVQKEFGSAAWGN